MPAVAGWNVLPEEICRFDIGELCRQSVSAGKVTNATACLEWDGKSLASSFCCETCARIEGSNNSQSAFRDGTPEGTITYVMGAGNDEMESDALPLVRFL